MSPWGVVSEPTSANVEPIDDAYIASIRTRMQELLALDAQVGGNETSAQALRLFRSVHRRIGVSPCSKHLQRELYAAVGELAEIAGWLFYDADQQDAMRRINQEALYYLRWAGHRSLELLTLQNMSMQAEYLNRPNEALHIVQSVLEADRLSPRVPSRKQRRCTSTAPATMIPPGLIGLTRGSSPGLKPRCGLNSVNAKNPCISLPKHSPPVPSIASEDYTAVPYTYSQAWSMSATGGRLNSWCRTSPHTSVRWAQDGLPASCGKRCTPCGRAEPLRT